MKVLRNNELKDCPYLRLEDEHWTGHHQVLISLQRLNREQTLWCNYRGTLGIVIPGDAEAEALPLFPNSVELICIQIPKFTDGRGYSLAVMLRRSGYQGILRATGDILFDQVDYLRRCGFDEFELKDPVRQNSYPAPELTRHYQTRETVQPPALG